jgi:hypothetical protein
MPENGWNDEYNIECEQRKYDKGGDLRDYPCASVDHLYVFDLQGIRTRRGTYLLRAGIETLIVALFVILGVKVASTVSAWISLGELF